MVLQAEVVRTRPGDTWDVYTIHVTSPKFTPQMAREGRARQKALVANGVFSDVEAVVANVSKGKLRRVTSIRHHNRIASSKGRITWEIEVGVLQSEVSELF